MDTGRKIRYIIIVFLLLCAGIYLGIAYYYMDGFSFGTWINDIYCTGKSVDEVNAELLAQAPLPELTVVYPIYAGEVQKEAKRPQSCFVLEKEMVRQDYTRALQQLLQRQRPLLWPQNLFLQKGGYELEPTAILTEEGEKQFEQIFLDDKTVRAEISRDNCIRLERDDAEGFRLYDGKKNRLDMKKALDECKTAIASGQKRVVLSKGCYYQEKINAEERKQEALYRELCEFLDFTIVYDMGAEQVRFDRKTLTEMLETEEDENFKFTRTEEGDFHWDEKKVKAAIEKLADVYDTYGKPREFSMTGGGTVMLEKGTYGTQLDRKSETKWLLEALSERKSEKHTPVYLREAYARGENDIGDTYIEINMTKQKLWFYRKGKAEIETPIVTGNMMRHRETPEGVYYVYAKQKNRILRGPGYASHVNYWMPVKGGVGIHDALWRDEFGGDIYKKDGSHGCINIPLEAAEKLYGLIEIGIPAVMYYETTAPS